MKTLLTTVAFLVSFGAMAQVVQDTPAPAPDAVPAGGLQHAIGKICAIPVSAQIGDDLAANFALAYVWDTPLADTLFVRNSVYESKVTDPEGIKKTLELATFFDHGKIAEQCVSSFGAYSVAQVEVQKKLWADHPVGGVHDANGNPPDPLLTPPPVSGSVPTPKFQEQNSDE